MLEIPLQEVEFSKFSLSDTFGKVFMWNGKLYRGIFKESRVLALELFSSGLIGKLQQEKLVPKTKITDFVLNGFDLVIEHELLQPISYPHEWSFSMLKDAALCVLKVNKIALEYGFETKDCHAYNIIFHNNSPVFVDIGSFVLCPGGNVNLLCYEEFLMDYYHPLKIWKSGDYYTAKRIIADESALLPHKSYYNIQYGFPIKELGYYALKARKLKFKLLNKLFQEKKLNINYLKKKNNQIKHLIRITQKLSPPSQKSEWHNYHNKYFDISGNIINTTKRFERIVELINEYKINTITELAGNQGVVSKLILQKSPFVKKIICTDYDENAIDLLYTSIKHNSIFYNSIVPAVVNFITPLSNYFGVKPEKRFVSECVLALAVTHHLILTQRFNIDIIFSIIKLYTTQYAIIEFMPLGLWNGKIAPPLPEWYNKDWFVQHLEKYFSIISEEKTEENRITFFCKTLK